MSANAAPLSVSPIRQFHPDWKTMRFHSKRQYLVDTRQAKDLFEASSLLSRHGHAIRARRQIKKAGRRFTRDAVSMIGSSVGSIRVEAKCDTCQRIVYEMIHDSECRRHKTILMEHRQTKYALLCAACDVSPAADPVHAAEAEHERRAA